MSFEAIPNALAATRLGLPSPPGYGASQAPKHTGAYYFRLPSDSIYMGTYNGASATCSYWGYALESACHSRMECVYDVVKDKSWIV